MSDKRADGIIDDANTIAACALELAIVDHREPDEASQRTHAITACLLAASGVALDSGVGEDDVGAYMQSFLTIAIALKKRALSTRQDLH